MPFKPKGGFPSIVRKIYNKTEDDKIPTSRGFSDRKRIIDISQILENKKRENLFLAFGDDEEGNSNVEQWEEKVEYEEEQEEEDEEQDDEEKLNNSEIEVAITKRPHKYKNIDSL